MTNERLAESTNREMALSPSVRAFLRDARQGLSLPVPGHGNTSARLRALREQAAMDASVGRLFEAHIDARTILFEASVRPPSAAALAVWASGPSASLSLERRGDRFVLSGKRSFCGGASVVDAALVVVDSADGQRLVLIDLHQPGVVVDSHVWKADAFRDAGIATVHFTNVELSADALIGPPGWYGSRPGFWYGAVSVAALWAGIADSVLARLPALRRHRDEIASVSAGSIEASMWAVSALLDQAGAQIDAPLVSRGPRAAKAIALACRHTVRSHIESAIRCFDEEVGPAAAAFDAELGRTRNELAMSLAQSHGPRDLLALAQP